MRKTTNDYVNCLRLNKNLPISIAALRASNYALNEYNETMDYGEMLAKTKELFADCVDNNPKASVLVKQMLDNTETSTLLDSMLNAMQSFDIIDENKNYIGDFSQSLLNNVLDCCIYANSFIRCSSEYLSVEYSETPPDMSRCRFDVLLHNKSDGTAAVITKAFSYDPVTNAQLREISNHLNALGVSYNWTI